MSSFSLFFIKFKFFLFRLSNYERIQETTLFLVRLILETIELLLNNFVVSWMQSFLRCLYNGNNDGKLFKSVFFFNLHENVTYNDVIVTSSDKNCYVFHLYFLTLCFSKPVYQYEIVFKYFIFVGQTGINILSSFRSLSFFWLFLS